MAVIGVQPLYLRDVTLLIAADNYEKHVSGATFTPSVSQASWQGLSPDASVTVSTPATWQLALDYVQDWDTANSLSQYLHDNQGKTVTAVFQPRRQGGKKFTASISIVPGPIGGASGFATATVTMGSTAPVASAGTVVP